MVSLSIGYPCGHLGVEREFSLNNQVASVSGSWYRTVFIW